MKGDNQKKNAPRFKAAILIASSRSYKGIREDSTGPVLEARLKELYYPVVITKIVSDNRRAIVKVLKKWITDDKIDLILVSGGTGLSPDDVTPEASLQVIERRIPGMEEAMRHASLKITPNAMLSRAVAGAAGKSLIINLPGSPNGALENLRVVEPALEHALKLLNNERPDK